MEEEAATTFGILDIVPKAIKNPPEFTEAATLQAMAKLDIQAIDLVCATDIPDCGFRLDVAIELERRRIEAIQGIIQERSRILQEPPIDISRFLPKLCPAEPPRQKVSKVPKRTKAKARENRPMPLVHEEKDLLIRQKARERMELVMGEQMQMKQRKEQRQEECRRQQIQEERRIQRLRETKLHEYEKEKEKRQAHFLRLHRKHNPRKRKVLLPRDDETPSDPQIVEPQPHSLLLNGPRIRRLLTPINEE
jgi:hypothetical protein